MNKNKLKRIMKYFVLIIFCLLIFFTKNIQAQNVYFQAEDYENTSGSPTFAPWVVVADADASGGFYIDVVPDTDRSKPGDEDSDDTDGQARFTYVHAINGNVDVWIRWEFHGGTADSFYYKFFPYHSTGDKWKKIDGPDFNPFDWGKVLDEDLDAGTYTLKILYREDGSRVDRIFICTDNSEPSDALGLPPAIPTNLTVINYTNWQPSGGIMSISWERATNADSYELYTSTDNDVNSASLLLDTSGTNHILTGIPAFTTYYFWVKAFGPGGESDFSDVAFSYMPPPWAPTNAPNFLKAEYSGTNTDMVLVWSSVVFVSTYTLFWSTDINTTNVLTNFNAGQTNYAHINSTLGITNYYWVQAYNEKGGSGYSLVGKDIFMPPSTPEFSRAEYSGANVVLEWSEAGDETAYLIYRSTDEYITNGLTNLPANTTNYSDQNSVLDKTNYYWVKASNVLGVSGYSRITNVFLGKPDPPTNLTAVIPIDSENIEINWNEVDIAGVTNTTSYTLFSGTDPDPNNAINKLEFFYNTQTSYTDTTFPTSVMNYYWVKAYNINGESGFSLKASNILNRPDIPGPVTSTMPFLDAQINISWLNISHETSYTLFRSTDINTTNVLKGFDKNQTNYSDLFVLTNTVYYYWVKAYNRAGDWGFTAVTFITTTNIPSLPIPDLNIGRLNDIYNSPAVLSWSNVPNETSYTLYRSTDTNTNSAVSIKDFGPDVTSYIDTGIQINGQVDTIYYYWIKSFRNSYTRGFSDSVFTYVGKSMGLSIKSLSLAQGKNVWLQWNPTPGRIKIYRSLSPVDTTNNSPPNPLDVVTTLDYQDLSAGYNETYYYNVGYTTNVNGKDFTFLDSPAGDFAAVAIGVDDPRFAFANLMEFVSVYTECKIQSIKNPPDPTVNPIINGPMLGAYKFKVFKVGNAPKRVDVNVYASWDWQNIGSGVWRGNKDTLTDGNIGPASPFLWLYPQSSIVFDFNGTLVNILYIKMWPCWSDGSSWNELTVILETAGNDVTLPVVTYADAPSEWPYPHTMNIYQPAKKVTYSMNNTWGGGNYCIAAYEIECAWVPFFEEVTDENDLKKLESIQNKVGLTLPYNDFDGNGVPEIYNTLLNVKNPLTSEDYKVKEIGIFLLSLTGDEWTYLGGDVDTKTKSISFDSQSLGVFGIFPIDRSQLNNKIVNLSPHRFITADGDNENDFILFRIDPKKKKVKLDLNIYNLSGGLIYKLVRSQAIKNTYSVKWYGKTLHDEELKIGPYIYEVRFDDKTVENGVIIIVR